MKWFKHISDSLDDPFIFNLIEQHDANGYLVFFGILEIYAREFKTEEGWKLHVTLPYLRRKLNRTRNKLITNVLRTLGELDENFDRTSEELCTNVDKTFSKSPKWEVEIKGDDVYIFINKFKELMDESTLKKLRENEKSFRNDSGLIPKSEPTEEEADKDKDINTLVQNEVSDENQSPLIPEKEKDKKLDPNVNKPDCPHQEIIALYHEILSMMTGIRDWTPARQAILRARWLSKEEYQDVAWWRQFFEYIRDHCPLLIGEGNRGWKANLDWILQQKHFIKILEGVYYQK